MGSIVLVPAMDLLPQDHLSDGSIIATLSRSQGHTYATLEDGRQLIAPDHYLIGVTRPKSPDRGTTLAGRSGSLEATEAETCPTLPLRLVEA